MTMLPPATSIDINTAAGRQIGRPHGIGRSEDFGARLNDEGRDARLEEILVAVAVNALGPDAHVAIAREDWVRVEDAIRVSATAASTAALERLASDLESTLRGRMPELVRCIGEQRLRTELGYD